MKKIFKFSFGLFIFFSIFSLVSAATMIADVSIRNAKIVSQDGNNFHISFDLINGEGSQTGVRYGVKLVSGAKYENLIDQKAYPESVSLLSNSSKPIEIDYNAPSSLSGEYTLFLTSNNSSSFPLS